MSCILYQLKCCCGPRGCSSLCIGPIRESSTTRLMYSAMLVVVSVILIFSHENKIIQWVASEFPSTFNNTCIYIRAESYCQRLSGYKAIYRIAFSFSFYHLLMILLTICVSSSQGWRARIHNGFWFIKFCLITSIWVVLYFIPVFDKFIFAATIVGVISAFIFIVIQQVSLIDCAYEFNGYLRDKSSKNCCFTILLFAISTMLYLLTILAYIFIYYQFAIPSMCIKNRVVIIVNVTASAILILSSFVVNKHNQYRLYIPGGVTCVFVAFLTWTAISSAPDEMIPIDRKVDQSQLRMVRPYDASNRIFACRPDHQFFKSHFGKELHAYLGVVIMLITAVYSSIKSTIDYKRYGIKPSRSKMFSTTQLENIGEDVEMQELKRKSRHRISGSHLLTPLGDISGSAHKYKSMPNVNVVSSTSKKLVEINKSKNTKKSETSLNQSNSSASKIRKLNKRTRTQSDSVLDVKRSKDNLDIVEEEHIQSLPMDKYLIHDERYAVRYSYSWLHFIFMLAYLFVMVQLTNWYSPETSHILNFAETWPSMWMKITTSWVALILYGWSLMCPMFCIGRKLYEFPLDSMKRYRKKITKTS